MRIQGGGLKRRYRAAGSFGTNPQSDRYSIPIRLLRVLYALPNTIYEKWGREHVPTGYEYFCPHSSLGSYGSQKMVDFLKRMSLASSFYAAIRD